MPERERAKKRSETRRKSRNQKNKNAKLYSFEEEPENRVRIQRKLNHNGQERDRNGASRFLKGSRPTQGSGSGPTLAVGLTRPTVGSPVRTVVGLAVSAPSRVSLFLHRCGCETHESHCCMGLAVSAMPWVSFLSFFSFLLSLSFIWCIWL
jgi:hypothetical protein